MKALDLHQTLFASLYEETVKLLDMSDYDLADIQGNVRVMDQKMEMMAEIDKQLLHLMLENDDY